MARYEERLAAFQAVDFDDLIVLPAKLLARDAEVRDTWRERLRYILVDEYQDTNGVQYELLKLLAGERGLFTAVGDDDQSIYGWRGATLENLKRLPADYPSAEGDRARAELPLDRRILAAANAVIGHNAKLYEKKLWSDLGDGEPVAVVECDDEVHEAERAVARIESLRATRRSPSATSRSSIAPTTRRASSSRRCARPGSRTRSRAARASSTAPRSATCAPGCA